MKLCDVDSRTTFTLEALHSGRRVVGTVVDRQEPARRQGAKGRSRLRVSCGTAAALASACHCDGVRPFRAERIRLHVRSSNANRRHLVNH
jgi:hypothetical protein